MMFSDTYKTIENEAKGLYKDRGSRFIAIAIPVTTQEEIKADSRSSEKSIMMQGTTAMHGCCHPTGRHGVSMMTVSRQARLGNP